MTLENILVNHFKKYPTLDRFDTYEASKASSLVYFLFATGTWYEWAKTNSGFIKKCFCPPEKGEVVYAGEDSLAAYNELHQSLIESNFGYDAFVNQILQPFQSSPDSIAKLRSFYQTQEALDKYIRDNQNEIAQPILVYHGYFRDALTERPGVFRNLDPEYHRAVLWLCDYLLKNPRHIAFSAEYQNFRNRNYNPPVKEVTSMDYIEVLHDIQDLLNSREV